MATLANIYLKKETIDLIIKTVEAKGLKGLGLTIAINDEMDKYGQNVSCYVSQTKEERESKKDRFYVGNGSVIYSKGEPLVVTQQMKDNLKNGMPSSQSAATSTGNSGLPF